MHLCVHAQKYTCINYRRVMLYSRVLTYMYKCIYMYIDISQVPIHDCTCTVLARVSRPGYR